MKDLKPATRALVESMKAAMTMDNNGMSVTEPTWLEKTLPDGITMDHIKKVQEHESTLVAVQAVALAELGLPVMQQNPDLTQISASLMVGGNTMATDIIREYQHGKQTINGHVISSYTVNAAGANRGELAVAVKLVRSMADDLLTTK